MIAIGGILPALYLTRLFTTLPFIQLKLWELTQQNQLTIFQYILAFGPIFLVALMSLPSYVSRLTAPKLLIILCAFLPFAVFLSPLPKLVGITPVRVLSTLSIACIVIIATEGVMKLKSRGMIVTILAVLTLILLPNHFQSTTLASTFDTKDAYEYLSLSDYNFLTTASRVSRNDNDVFLIIWPYNVVFPGLTGKRSYHGHSLLTIQSADKDLMAQHVFDGSMPADTLRGFLADNHIRYVITYTWAPALQNIPFLQHVTSTPNLILYHVTN